MSRKAALFTVGDKPFPNREMAIAYAMHAVGRDGNRDTLYVRELNGQIVRTIVREPRLVTLK